MGVGIAQSGEILNQWSTTFLLFDVSVCGRVYI